MHQPEHVINRVELFKKLKSEAPDFLGTLLKLEVPEADDRLRLPVVETPDKVAASELNEDAVKVFIKENCYYDPGSLVTMAEFYEKFITSLEPVERVNWTKPKVSAGMPDQYVKGRLSTNPDWHWGNLSFEEPESIDENLILISVNNKLILKKEVVHGRD